ncbi:MAG: glycosyltransferase family 9 protein [Deltaproteobacteria bacterium]|jgi:ADP-heptose:LPS heptosyltransferase|nr:glycosyltransferase family 9 protein [Deltaproteobacteria bacterium]
MEKFIGFQLKNLGDVLMTLPALALLKTRRPGCQVTMVVRPLTAALLANHPLVDAVIPYQFQPRSLGLGESRRLVRALRQSGARVSFHFDGQRRGGLVALWAGLDSRAVGLGLLGVSGLKSPWLYNQKISLRSPGAPWESLALSHQRLVAAVLGEATEPGLVAPGLNIPERARAKARALLAQTPGAGPLIGLTLLGRQREKSWPLDFWAQVLQALAAQTKARFYVTGEAGEGYLADQLAQLAGVPAQNFCGQTDLLEFVALAAASDLFLTIDTGSAHLVALTETPLITIFTATNPAQWGALSRRRTQICYNWALARFGLSSGPDYVGYPIVRPPVVIEAALAFLAKGQVG